MGLNRVSVALVLGSMVALTGCETQGDQGANGAANHQPAVVTTYAESHPHPEFNMTYAANADTRSADTAQVVIKRGVCVWFKGKPDGATAEGRLENGEVHPLTVGDFYQVADVTTKAPG